MVDHAPYQGRPRPYTMGLMDRMMRQFDDDVGRLRDGLLPENLAYWYGKVTADAVEMAPPWLQDKIAVRQDPILPMKFDLDISRRAVRYFAIAVEKNMGDMPRTTRLYFLKVQQAVSSEMDKSLV